MYIRNSVQEFSEQRLLALNKSGKELVVDTSGFPPATEADVYSELCAGVL